MKHRLPKVQYYKDRKKEWRWRFIAPNGRILACSSEGYTRRAKAINCFHSISKAFWNSGIRSETL